MPFANALSWSALAALEIGLIALSAQAQATPRSSHAPRVLASAVSYTGELAANAAGGARRGTVYVGLAAAQLTIDPSSIVRWKGATLFVLAVDAHGGAPSNLVGDAQGVSSLQAPPRIWLEEAWLQQNVFGDRLSLLAGRYDVNSEFYRLRSASVFLNASFGIGPELATSGVGGPSIYPNTAVGARLDFKPSRNTVLRLATLDGAPADRPGGGFRAFAPGDGALLIGEAAMLSRSDSSPDDGGGRFRIGRGVSRAYDGKIAIGAWYYTARFSDLIDTIGTGAPLQHHGSGGVYLIADRTVWSAASGPRLITAFAQLGVGNPHVDKTARYIGGGLSLVAPIATRSHDVLGAAIAVARNGSQVAQSCTGIDCGGTAESAAELTYLAMLGAHLSAQADVQYVVHPGGSLTLHSAIVPAVRVSFAP